MRVEDKKSRRRRTGILASLREYRQAWLCPEKARIDRSSETIFVLAFAQKIGDNSKNIWLFLAQISRNFYREKFCRFSTNRNFMQKKIKKRHFTKKIIYFCKQLRLVVFLFVNCHFCKKWQKICKFILLCQFSLQNAKILVLLHFLTKNKILRLFLRNFLFLSIFLGLRARNKKKA